METLVLTFALVFVVAVLGRSNARTELLAWLDGS